jgi:hypothetical protein
MAAQKRLKKTARKHVRKRRARRAAVIKTNVVIRARVVKVKPIKVLINKKALRDGGLFYL